MMELGEFVKTHRIVLKAFLLDVLDSKPQAIIQEIDDVLDAKPVSFDNPVCTREILHIQI
jgi:hypothetical protein